MTARNRGEKAEKTRSKQRRRTWGHHSVLCAGVHVHTVMREVTDIVDAAFLCEVVREKHQLPAKMHQD